MIKNKQAKQLIQNQSADSLVTDAYLSQNKFTEIWGKQNNKTIKDIGWFYAPNNQKIINEIEQFINRENIKGFSKILFVGIGGATITAEILLHLLPESEQSKFKILDNIDACELNSISRDINIDKTLFVIMSKSGNTIETLSQLSFFWKFFSNGKNYIAITEPKSILYDFAINNNFLQIFECPKNIGGRFASLSYLGIVPALLMNINVKEIMQDAQSIKKTYVNTPESHDSITLGRYLASAINKNIQNVIIIIPERLLFFGKWIEQMIAESLGKNSLGITPLIYFESDIKNLNYKNSIVINYVKNTSKKFNCPKLTLSLNSEMNIGRQIYMWQIAIAYSGQLLQINPFNQPDVEKVKINPTNISKVQKNNNFDDLSYEFLLKVKKIGTCLHILSFGQKDNNYIKKLIKKKKQLEVLLKVPVNIQYAPRYLHSVGQLHKNGQTGDNFIFIDNIKINNINIPGYDFSFSDISYAQFNNDAKYLQEIKKNITITQIDELVNITNHLNKN